MEIVWETPGLVLGPTRGPKVFGLQTAYRDTFSDIEKISDF
jgi:hypothetical protein